MQKNGFSKVAVVVALFGVLVVCGEHYAAAGQFGGAMNSVASQAGQRFDQATNYVGDQVGSVKQTAQQNLQSADTPPSITASGVAAEARANMTGAASSANAAIANAASDAGAAGHRLQGWTTASGTSATGSSGSTSSGSSSDSGSARTDMDK